MATVNIGQHLSDQYPESRKEVNRSSISASDPTHPLSVALKNRPFSNLMHNEQSKSQTRPKKGILKKQVSSNSQKTKPIQFKTQNSQKLHSNEHFHDSKRLSFK